jgi:hypothetical protein
VGGPHTCPPVLRFVRCGARASGLSQGVVVSLWPSLGREPLASGWLGDLGWGGGADQRLPSAVGDIIGVAMAGSCLLAGDVPVTVGANGS